VPEGNYTKEIRTIDKRRVVEKRTYSSSQNSGPIDLLVKEISQQSFWYLSILFLINWEISIYEWLMNFQLGVDLFRHYTWVSVKYSSFNLNFLSLSCWSSGQSGWLTQWNDFRLEVRISERTKHFANFIFRINVWKPVKNGLKNQIKLLSVQKEHYFETYCTLFLNRLYLYSKYSIIKFYHLITFINIGY
jgi:hypothetical protein